MCGIVCYVGRKDAAEELFEGLKNLEYRGYDSAGLGIICDDGEIAVVKRQGRVEKLGPYIAAMHGHVGIGHTRWATHGKPSDTNAHPHSAGEISLVHNGIIENYAELKAALEAEGESFFSETDTEVIAKILNRNYNGDLLSALSKTVKVLNGSYALMAICKGGHTVALAKQKSPLIIGYGNGEIYCASDQPALAGKCGFVTPLQDGDLAQVSFDGVKIYDSNLTPVVREKIINDAPAASLDLNGYPHYMLKELHETPQTVKNTVKAFLNVKGQVGGVLAGVDRVVLLGCGTAYHAALAGKRYFESFARVCAEAEIASEFRYKNPVITPRTAVIAVSQSGETADTVEAAKLAMERGAKVVAVTNSPRSALTRIASLTVPVEAGSEICVAATKSYAGQIAALYLCALAFAGERELADGLKKLEPLPGICAEVATYPHTYAVAQMCARSSGVYFLGRDLDYATAVEGSLKLKEVSYVPSEGYPAGELKHGTLAMIDGNTVSITVISDNALAEKSLNAVEQILSRGGKAVIITCIDGVKEKFAGRAQVITVPETDKFLSPVVNAVVLQLIAYRTAVMLGRDPDKPRHLAKSVTVE